MATFYLDLEGGNDANDGTSFANRWKTFGSGATAARIAPGDTIRVMASKDPTSVGNADWTNNSATVTLAAAKNAIVDACEAAWTAATNVTATATGTRKEGLFAASLAIASGFTTGLAAYMRRIDEAADVSAHRYWRVLFSSSAGGGDVAVGELEMKETAGGIDQCTGGSAISSSEYSGSYLDDYAFDNNNTTAWNSTTAGLPQYVGYDFGSGVTKNIVQITVRARSDYQGNAPAAWTVQYSDDGSSWSTSWSVTGQAGWASQEQRTFSKPTVATTPYDLSAYQQLTLWVRANAAVSAGVLELRLCSDTVGATAVDTLALPAIPLANVWQAVTIDKGSALGSNINSVALYAASDPGTVTVLLDNITACKASSSDDSLTLNSVIGKAHAMSWAASTAYSTNDIRIPTTPNRTGFGYKVTAGGTTGSSEPSWPEGVGMTVTDGSVVWTCLEPEEVWYPIRSISGTTLGLDTSASTQSATASRKYQGATETVATYKREPILQTPQTSGTLVNEIKDSGTATGGKIVFSGGWDRTNMSTQAGQTWVSGQNGQGIAFGANLQVKNWELQHFGAVRYNLGFYTNTNVIGAYWLTHCKSVGMDDAGFYNNTSPVLLYFKGVAAVQCSGVGVYWPGGPYADMRRARVEGNGDGVATTNNIGVSFRGEEWLVRGNGGWGVIHQNRETPSWIFGLKTANNGTGGVYDISGTVKLHNALLAESTEITMASNQGYPWQYTASGKHDGTADSHKLVGYGFTITSATDQRHTASGVSWKFSITDTVRSEFVPVVLPIAKLACAANVAMSITIWTRRSSTDIKGRFRVRGGQLAGVPETTVTCEPSINTYTQSSAITFTPTENGVVELEYVCWDGVGTTNNLWIDDLTVA